MDVESASYIKCIYNCDLHQPSIQGAINNYLADHPYLDGYTPTQLDPSVHQLLRDSDINFVNYPHLKRWYDHIETFTDAEKAKFAKVEMLKNIQRKVEDTFKVRSHLCEVYS